MNAPKPWYFKDGTPINPEQIRRLVERAKLIKQVHVNEVKSNSGVSRNLDQHTRELISFCARYYAEKMEEYLTELLAAEFDSLHTGRILTSGNCTLDAKRLWRRSYMRRYRLKKRVFDNNK